MTLFAKRLKAARQSAGFRSAQAFAEHLGADPHRYRKYERGSAEPDFELLTRICEHLKITPNDLLPLAAANLREHTGGKAA